MRVLLLCDGGGQIGVGHVIRSLALAEHAVAAGHEVVLAGRLEGAFLQGQLAAAPVEVISRAQSLGDSDPPSLVDLIRSVGTDVLHVDGYEVSAGLAGAVASAGVKVVFSNVEDGSFGRRPADVVIDPTVGAELSARPDDGSTWLLRGSRYTPIRDRVVNARKPFGRSDGGAVGADGGADGRADHQARSVLVVMGGTDPVGLAPAAVGLLARTGLALDVTVVAVGENAERVRAAARGSRLSLDVVAPIDDLAEVMSRQDLVVSAAGTSVWELCCLGVPMAIIWAVDNQRDGYDQVVAAGAALGLGGPDLGGPGLGGPDLGGEFGGDAVGVLTAALTDSQLRAEMAFAGRRIVDGLGAWRVVRTWELAVRQRRTGRTHGPLPMGNAGLVARPATLDDARLLWEWRNDPATRASSRHPEPVPWPDHLAWLEAGLTRTDRKLFLVDDEIGPVGTVRWDLEPDEGNGPGWEVSITIAPERRGQSLARPLLLVAEGMLTQVTHDVTPPATATDVTATDVTATDVTAYLAVVHVDNQPSIRLFETSGYLPDLPPDGRGFMRFRKAARVA